MAFWQWSKTAGNNASVDSTINMTEGMPPAQLNDGVRAVMARLAEYRDDTAGVAIITSGVNTAFTVSTNQGFTSLTALSGAKLKVQFNQDCGAFPTINVDGTGSIPLDFGNGLAVNAGMIKAGSIYDISFLGSPAGFAFISGGHATMTMPIGACLDFAGSVAPPLFVMCFGQSLSTTTYAALFGIIGYTFGGAGANFNTPDFRGRTAAGLDNMGGSAAGRIGTALVTDSGTINGQSMGSAGGSQTHIQTSGELATHNHTGSGNVSDPTHLHAASSGQFIVSGGSGVQIGGTGLSAVSNTAAASTGVTVPSLNINNTGSGAAMAWLQPTIMMNKIMYAGV